MRKNTHTDRTAYEHRRPAPPVERSIAISIVPVAFVAAIAFPRLTLAFFVGITLGLAWERR